MINTEIKKCNNQIGQQFSSIYKLIVKSELPVTANYAWETLLQSNTLHFVAQRIMLIKPVCEPFPKEWEQNKIFKTRMFMYGFIPYGGIHAIFFKKIDPNNFIIETEESNNSFRMWNHTMRLEKTDNNKCVYTDEVLINNGWMTLISVKWAKYYYKHRHKRWLKLITMLSESQIS